MLEVVRHESATEFLAAAGPWLLEREAESNLLLSVAYLLERRAAPFRFPAYLASVTRDGSVIGAAMCPPPDGVYLTDLPLDAVPPVVAQVREFMGALPEMIGPEEPSFEFARLWAGDAWTVNSRFRRYTLERVVPPSRPANGQLRLGTEADLPLLDRWAREFAAEVGSKVDTASLYRAFVERRALYLWDDDGPRCLVSVSGVTPNGARVSGTYTPVEHRGKGYAESAVAAASQTILDGGRRFAMIAADVEEEVPTKIYRRIGYRPLDELVLIHFG